MTITRALLVMCLVAPRLAVADAKADAQALFDRGITELKAGNTAEACKLLGASLAKHEDSGTKGALALCQTKLGKLASAWTLWRELAVTAPSEQMKSDAGKRAAELEPRLPRYTVKAPAITGLVVTINGTAVDLSVQIALPVDPGTIEITARAPDHEDWIGTATATEAQTTAIEIPALEPLPKVETPIVPPPRTPRRRTGLLIGLAATSGATIVTGALFGARANSKMNAAESACGGDIANCPGDAFAKATDDYNAAKTAATASTVMFGVGAAALAGTIVVWYLGREQTVTPIAGGDRVGIVLSGRW